MIGSGIHGRKQPGGSDQMKGKERESEVIQSCPTMDCSLPGSSVHGIFQARVLEWVAIWVYGYMQSQNCRFGRPGSLFIYHEVCLVSPGSLNDRGQKTFIGWGTSLKEKKENIKGANTPISCPIKDKPMLSSRAICIWSHIT